MKNFAKRLNEALSAKGLKQNQFAELLGIAPSSVNLWLSAKTMPKVENLPQVARILGISIDYLLGFDIAPENDTQVPDLGAATPSDTMHISRKNSGEYWKEKYYKLLEENNQLLKNQINSNNQ